ncbi:MAG TPA: alpha/beta hydrolase [Anaerolineae bacterium]|nr:alpha/beta hydrolase [Anaerolineae bacterium]
MITHQTLSIEGRSAKVWLGGSGRPLVLLHGGFGDAQQHWHATFQAFVPHFHIIAPDLPGFGVSAPLAAPNFQSYLSWINVLFEMLGLAGPLLMMGNSFGAAIARLYAAANTGEIDRLVLVDGGAIQDVGGCARSIFQLPIVSPFLLELARRQSFSNKGLRKAIHVDSVFTPEFAANAHAASHGFVTSMKEIATNEPPSLRTPTCPTLIVWGEYDGLSSTANGQRLSASIPHSEFALIKDAGHLPQIEQPQAFQAVVLKFLESK